MRKKRLVRQKQPFLKKSGLPVQTLNWRDNIPELLLVFGLLANQTTQQVATLFQNLQEELTKSSSPTCRSFSGRLTQLADCLQADGPLAPNIREHLRALFIGPNAALLRRFDVPGKKILLTIINPPDGNSIDDYKQLMRVVGKAFEHRGGRATRAKLVELLLLAPGLKGFHSLQKENLEPILAAKDDEIPQDSTAAKIRASWNALQARHASNVTDWQIVFWLQGGRQTPCLRKPDHAGTSTVELDSELARFVKEIDRIWFSVIEEEPRHDIPFIGEVTLGLMGRVWRMMHYIIDLSRAGNGEMAEIALRCQFDSFVTLEWLLRKNDPKLFQRFVDYSAGKDKALLEYARKMPEYGRPEFKQSMEQTLVQEIGEAGAWEQLVAEERGAWTDASTRDMAKDVKRENAYMFVFSRASDIVHGSYRALKRYHLQGCSNPLHQYHWVPYAGPTHDAGLTPIMWGIMNTGESLRAVSLTVSGPHSAPAEAAGKLLESFRTLINSRSPLNGFSKAGEFQNS